MIQFKLDENLPAEAASVLAMAGFDVKTVAEQSLSGHPDSEILAVCDTEQRALITLDTDFANLLAYPPKDHAGLIVLRLSQQSKEKVLLVLRRLVPVLKREALAQRLWIVEETQVRIRDE